MDIINNNVWILKGGEVFTPTPFAIMGIVNITPDSFSDGGKYNTELEALAHASKLWQEGASILDLGAESSRPGAKELSADEELTRLMPVLNPLSEACKKNKLQDFALKKEIHLNLIQNTINVHNLHEQQILNLCPSKPPYISIDTYHAKTARYALEAGAHIINDISACSFEPELLDIIVQYKPGYVLMHSTASPSTMQDKISSDDIIETLQYFFEKQLHRLTQAGLPEEHIILDPGIGFGKSVKQNLQILNSLNKFKHFNRPILAAISMKSFIHKSLGLDSENLVVRATATQHITALLGAEGITYHRVHKVKENIQALKIAYALNNVT